MTIRFCHCNENHEIAVRKVCLEQLMNASRSDREHASSALRGRRTGPDGPASR